MHADVYGCSPESHSGSSRSLRLKSSANSSAHPMHFGRKPSSAAHHGPLLRSAPCCHAMDGQNLCSVEPLTAILAGRHAPIPEMIAATDDQNVSGHPVYDAFAPPPRPECTEEGGEEPVVRSDGCRRIVLVGDAAHPMAPFKAQVIAPSALHSGQATSPCIVKGCCPPLPQQRISASGTSEFFPVSGGQSSPSRRCQAC